MCFYQDTAYDTQVQPRLGSAACMMLSVWMLMLRGVWWMLMLELSGTCMMQGADHCSLT